MKAIVYTKYGPPDVLQLKEVEKPTPNDNEVLIKVHAASVNAFDLHFLRGDPFFLRLMAGLLKPKKPILGVDVAGQVEAVGRNVQQFRPGDEVFGDLSGCGMGAFAEYACGTENVLALKPAGMTFEQAAAVPMAGMTALVGLRDHGHVQPGQRVLITGASGGCGTFAVQMAKAFGAEVTAVCSTGKVDFVRSIGADHVVDYTREDVTKYGQRYDLILDMYAHRSFLDYRRVLSPTGIYLLVGGSIGHILPLLFLGPWLSRAGGMRFGNYVNQPDQKYLVFINQLIEAGKVVPVIDRCYPLREAAEAFRRVEQRKVQGKVVITI